MKAPFFTRTVQSILVFFAALLLFSNRASAAGLACVSSAGDLRIEALFAAPHIEEPVQIEALRILHITQSGNIEFVAGFATSEGNLANRGQDLAAVIDPALQNSAAANKHIGRTTLGALKEIRLLVKTAGVAPLEEANDSTFYSARVTYLKNDGERLYGTFNCEWVLENSRVEQVMWNGPQ